MGSGWKRCQALRWRQHSVRGHHWRWHGWAGAKHPHPKCYIMNICEKTTRHQSHRSKCQKEEALRANGTWGRNPRCFPRIPRALLQKGAVQVPSTCSGDGGRDPGAPSHLAPRPAPDRPSAPETPADLGATVGPWRPCREAVAFRVWWGSAISFGHLFFLQDTISCQELELTEAAWNVSTRRQRAGKRPTLDFHMGEKRHSLDFFTALRPILPTICWRAELTRASQKLSFMAPGSLPGKRCGTLPARRHGHAGELLGPSRGVKAQRCASSAPTAQPNALLPARRRSGSPQLTTGKLTAAQGQEGGQLLQRSWRTINPHPDFPHPGLFV